MSVQIVSQTHSPAQAPTFQNGREWMVWKARSSAIAEDMIALNFEWVEGDYALELLTETGVTKTQKGITAVGAETRRYLDLKQYIQAGAYRTLPHNRDASEFLRPFKPRTEQKGFGPNAKTKTVKCETPWGAPSTPLLPQWSRTAIAAFNRRYDRHITESGDVWAEVLADKTIPVTITEGWEKACCLVTQGVPTIAVRGVEMFRAPKAKKTIVASFRRKQEVEVGGDRPLAPEIAQYCEGRETYIVYDAPEYAVNPSVRNAAITLGKKLIEIGATPSYPAWDGSLGKGIDDAIASIGAAPAFEWLAGILDEAIAFEDFKKGSYKTTCRRIAAKLSETKLPAERETVGPYMPDLPALEPGTLVALIAAMGSGKSWQLRRLLREMREEKGTAKIAVYVAPTNQLGRQLAKAIDAPHIHDYATDVEGQAALLADIGYRGAVVLCPNSLPRIPQYLLDRIGLLIFDEATQVSEDLASGGTLKAKQGQVLGLLADTATKILASGGNILIAEARLPDQAIAFYKDLCGLDWDRVRIFRHRREQQAWDVQISREGYSDFVRDMVDAAKNHPIIVAADTKKEAEKLERIFEAQYPGAVRRQDSSANGPEAIALAEDPHRYCKANEVRVLIFTSALKSGVSIEGNAGEDPYFQEVWGVFRFLDPNTHLQMLGRVRAAVPRKIFCSSYIGPLGDERHFSAKELLEHLEQKRALFAAKAGIKHDALEAMMQGKPAQAQRLQALALRYHGWAASVRGALKRTAFETLSSWLQEAGHTVREVGRRADKTWTKILRDVREEIEREKAEIMASLPIDPECHTLEWARKILDGMESTEAQRTLAQKVLLSERFGPIWDDADNCFQAYYREDGRKAKALWLRALAANTEAAYALEAPHAGDILKADFVALQQLPKQWVAASILEKLGVLDFAAAMQGQTYTSESPEAIALHERCLPFRQLIANYLGLKIAEDHTPVTTTNKLLKKLGFHAQKGARRVVDGEQRFHEWAIAADDALTVVMLEGAIARLAAAEAPEPLETLIPEPTQAEPTSLPEALEAKQAEPPTPHYCPAKGDLVSIAGGHPEGYYIADLDLSHAYLLSADGESMVYAPITGLKPLEAIAS